MTARCNLAAVSFHNTEAVAEFYGSKICHHDAAILFYCSKTIPPWCGGNFTAAKLYRHCAVGRFHIYANCNIIVLLCSFTAVKLHRHGTAVRLSGRIIVQPQCGGAALRRQNRIAIMRWCRVTGLKMYAVLRWLDFTVKKLNRNYAVIRVGGSKIVSPQLYGGAALREYNCAATMRWCSFAKLYRLHKVVQVYGIEVVPPF